VTHPKIIPRRIQCPKFPVSVMTICTVMLEISFTILFSLPQLAEEYLRHPRSWLCIRTIPSHACSSYRSLLTIFTLEPDIQFTLPVLLNTATHVFSLNLSAFPYEQMLTLVTYDCCESLNNCFLMHLCKGRPNR
jgi:hypothetical protein